MTEDNTKPTQYTTRLKRILTEIAENKDATVQQKLKASELLLQLLTKPESIKEDAPDLSALGITSK